MKKIIFILLIIPFFSTSQLLEKANQDYAVMNYTAAIDNYEKYIAKADAKQNKKKNKDEEKAEEERIQILTNLADSYYSLQQYSKAEEYYMDLYDIKGNAMPEPLFVRLISSLRSINNTRRAKKLFDSYYAKSEKNLKTRDYQKKKLDSLHTLYNRVVNMDVNSKYSDFGVALKGDEVVFSTAQSTGEEHSYLNLYKAVRNKNNGQISAAKPYLPNLNTSYNDATFSFVNGSDLVLFSRNYITSKGKLDAKNGMVSHVMIMVGKLRNNHIKDIQPLKFNSPDYNCSHPFVTEDGKHLYFASDKPGGFGGTDIYVVDLYNDGSTGDPSNLGPTINSPGSEMYPSLYGDTLFFSSDFYYGYGGLDVFSSEMKGEGNYTIPENLGKPINSNEDDFAFIRLPDRTGYFSSNRKNGKGSDDIYWYNMKKLITDIQYSGLVLVKGDNKPIPNANIKVYDVYGEVTQEGKSDSLGNYALTLPCGQQFKIEFGKKDFSTESVYVATPKKPKDSTNNKVFLTAFSSLVDKSNGVEKIKVNPIYFDYDKWDITPKAEVELGKVLFAMKKFPKIKIKIESHTDSRGSDSYNLKLSDERAKSTKDYLISQGIDPSRILSAIGYGETRPLNKCTNGVHCSDAEFAVNRRSDFIIVDK